MTESKEQKIRQLASTLRESLNIVNGDPTDGKTLDRAENQLISSWRKLMDLGCVVAVGEKEATVRHGGADY